MDPTMNPDCREYHLARTREYARRMRIATERILEVSTELHLTWNEFENVLDRIKERAYICVKPMTLDGETSGYQSSGS